MFKKRVLFNSNEHFLEKCLCHYDFRNPLGNKTHKHDISAFYYFLGNLQVQLKSRLKKIFTYNHVHNILEFRSVLVEFLFTTSKTKLISSIINFMYESVQTLPNDLAFSPLGGLICPHKK